MRQIFELEITKDNNNRIVDDIYTEDEAILYAENELEVDPDIEKIKLKGYAIDYYGNKIDEIVSYYLKESKEYSDVIFNKNSQMSNDDIIEWIEIINEDNFIELPIKILDSEDKKTFITLINEYKQNRFTKKVEPILIKMQELLDKEVIEDDIIKDELEIEIEVVNEV